MGDQAERVMSLGYVTGLAWSVSIAVAMAKNINTFFTSHFQREMCRFSKLKIVERELLSAPVVCFLILCLNYFSFTRHEPLHILFSLSFFSLFFLANQCMLLMNFAGEQNDHQIQNSDLHVAFPVTFVFLVSV